MSEPTRFLTDEKGERVAVVISIDEYEKMLDELEELWAIRAYDEAKKSGETAVPMEEALARIENQRKRK